DAPAGAQIDPATGAFSWTPAADQAPGDYAIGVRVRDPFTPTFTDVASFTVQVQAAPSPEVLFVQALYRTVLHREADTSGLNGWVNLRHNGTSREQVAQGIWESVEHRGLEVDQFYATYLHRAADAGGRAFWVDALRSGEGEEAVAVGFVTSEEYRQSHEA